MVYGYFVDDSFLVISKDEELLEIILDHIYIFNETFISNFQLSKT